MLARLTTVAALSLVAAGCATSPTGQPQLRLFPESQMAQMGAAAFDAIQKETPVSEDRSRIAYVQCVADAVTANVASDVQWEVRVFDSPQANAFALPGGKIGVYTGMLDVAADQSQLAAVIGHEISHVTAHHGNARVSAQYATQAGLDLAAAVAGPQTPMRQQLFGLLGLGAQYGVLLPYGRAQESEADAIGVDLMARAGFDPRGAIELWRNMSRQGGAKPPTFLSTHPSPEGRIAALERQMPDAMRLYEAAQAAGKRPDCR